MFRSIRLYIRRRRSLSTKSRVAADTIMPSDDEADMERRMAGVEDHLQRTDSEVKNLSAMVTTNTGKLDQLIKAFNEFAAGFTGAPPAEHISGLGTTFGPDRQNKHLGQGKKPPAAATPGSSGAAPGSSAAAPENDAAADPNASVRNEEADDEDGDIVTIRSTSSALKDTK